MCGMSFGCVSVYLEMAAGYMSKIELSRRTDLVLSCRSATQQCAFPTDAQVLQSVTKTANNGRRLLAMTSDAPWAVKSDSSGAVLSSQCCKP